jgi:hypothetical protein
MLVDAVLVGLSVLGHQAFWVRVKVTIVPGQALHMGEVV